MKRVWAMLLALVLCFGAVSAHADANRLGLEILTRLYDGERNQFVSPVSLDYALCMAAAGADGETFSEIASACGFENPMDVEEWNAPLEEAGLKWANAIFAQDDLPVRLDYLDALRARLGAELFPLDDPERVNSWVDEHTDHLIDRLVDDLDPTIRLILINAIAMDAQWAREFDADASYGDTFHAPSGDVTANFMHDTFYAEYGENDLAQYIKLYYRNSGLYMLLALPREGKLVDALDGIALDGVNWFSPLERRRIRLSLPKIDISVSNSLTEPLIELGIERAFSDGADFSGISEQPLKISDVLQKVRVQMDEEGTRAAAVTAVMMETAMAPMEEEAPTEFNVNRPYIALIAEEQTGAVCFAGVVCDPTQS